MKLNYHRYKELKEKAVSRFNGRGSLGEQLANAVVEIDKMRQSEVPEHRWAEVQDIISKCNTHPATREEGYFRASIDRMSTKEQLDLKAAILSL